MNDKYSYEIKVPAYLLGLVGKLNDYADKLGYCDNYRYFGYNGTQGNVYIYSEYEQYSLFISEFDTSKKIQFCYTDSKDGEELLLDEQDMLDALGYQVIEGANDKISEYFNKWQDDKDNK